MTSSESTPPTLASEEVANQKTPRLLPPTITVGRLVVFKDNRIVLETVFHKGLNIVSGHNSSGKTTTLDFLAHTIGAEDIPWKKEALLCE